ncbi:c-Myc-binding protein homolog [Drosophila tropicalis]|uniref:c-Myc-binding protein homolog n=1 Tax=Drosophila tropicalis TaxID=46794 RepID=UPI0035ABFD9D
MSFKPIDPKRDEIRRYLERGSVVDSLTKIFIRVIKERPENPMEYIRNNIGVVRRQQDKYDRLQQDLQTANEEIQRLRAIINSINPDVLKEQSLVQAKHQPEAEVQNQSEATLEKVVHSEPDPVSELLDTVKQEVKSEKIGDVIEDSELASVAEKQLNIEETTPTALEKDVKVDSSANQNQNSSVQAEVKSENNE